MGKTTGWYTDTIIIRLLCFFLLYHIQFPRVFGTRKKRKKNRSRRQDAGKNIKNTQSDSGNATQNRLQPISVRIPRK